MDFYIDVGDPSSVSGSDVNRLGFTCVGSTNVCTFEQSGVPGDNFSFSGKTPQSADNNTITLQFNTKGLTSQASGS